VREHARRGRKARFDRAHALRGQSRDQREHERAEMALANGRLYARDGEKLICWNLKK
jgi:hypothetical protein